MLNKLLLQYHYSITQEHAARGCRRFEIWRDMAEAALSTSVSRRLGRLLHFEFRNCIPDTSRDTGFTKLNSIISIDDVSLGATVAWERPSIQPASPNAMAMAAQCFVRKLHVKQILFDMLLGRLFKEELQYT